MLKTALPNITFAMLKSDAINNHVDIRILNMIRLNNFRILSLFPYTRLSDHQIMNFYSEHVGRSYFDDLYRSVSSEYVAPMILEYNQKSFFTFESEALAEEDANQPQTAVWRMRKLIGKTNAREADADTIRGQFGGHIFDPDAPMAANAIHASDSWDSVIREIDIILPTIGMINTHSFGQFYVEELKSMTIS